MHLNRTTECPPVQLLDHFDLLFLLLPSGRNVSSTWTT